MKIKCEHCGEEIEVNPAQIMGQAKSERKAAAARNNGKKGGRPKKNKTLDKS